MKKICTCLSLFFVFSIVFSQNTKLEEHWWTPNGNVSAIYPDSVNNLIYIGGQFRYVGPREKFATQFNLDNGTQNLQSPNPNNLVSKSISDGKGGWYIGGEFLKIGDSVRYKIAHLDSLGTVLSDFSRMGFNGNVFDLALDSLHNKLYVSGRFNSYDSISKFSSYSLYMNVNSGNIIPNFAMPNGEVRISVPDGFGGHYIAGNFTMVGDSLRSYLAQIDQFGHVTNWNPSPNYFVTAIAVSTHAVYIGGYFSDIGGQSRNYLAALNPITGLATSWNPNANNLISCLSLKGSNVYVGGNFTSIGGVVRNYLASIDTITGNPTSWNPNPNNAIFKIFTLGSKLYVSGAFSNIGGLSRQGLAAININTGFTSAWNPSITGYVYSISPSNNSIYIGGSFTMIGGQTRNNLAELDTTYGIASAWNPNPDDIVINISVIGTKLYVSGNFTNFNSVIRNHFASFNTTTGLLLPILNPINIDYGVNTISVSGSTLYIGGAFELRGGITRNKIVEIDLNTNLATAFNPNPDDFITSLLVAGNSLYLGGTFQTIGNQARKSLASFNVLTGQLTSWNPNPNMSVYGIICSGNKLFVCGDFTNISGQAQNSIASFNLNSGLKNAWNPNVVGYINRFIVKGNSLYVAGGFWSIGGQPSNSIAAIDTSSGSLLNFSPNGNNSNFFLYGITAFAILNNSIYVSGIYNGFGNSILSLDPITGSLSNINIWPKIADNYIYTICPSKKNLYVGGYFSSIGGVRRNSLVALDMNTGAPTSWNPLADTAVYALEVLDSTIYAGGYFSGTANTKTVLGINTSSAIINPQKTFASQLYSQVYCLTKMGNTFYVGGRFRNFGGQVRSSLASFDASSGAINPWSPIVNSNNWYPSVFSISLNGNSAFVGGSFDSINGVLRENLAEIDLNNASLTSWNPIVNDEVYTTSIYNNSLYIGGRFDSINGQMKNNLAAFNLSNGLLSSWNPIASINQYAFIRTLFIKNNNLFIGGYFNRINGKKLPSIASFNITSGVLNNFDLKLQYGNFLTLNVFKNKLLMGGNNFSFSSGNRDFAVVNLCNSGVPSSSNMNISACNSFNWNGTIYNTSGAYIKTFTNAASCDSIVTLYLTINAPNVSIVNNSNGTITATGGTNYKWLNCATNQVISGANSAIYTPMQNGNYAAIVSNSSGCSDTTACVNFSTSGLKQTSLLSASIYPNPSKDIVTITLTENKAKLEVTDVLGKNKLMQTIQCGEAISMKDWPIGIYFFKLKTENGVTTQKVVKR
jgi:hypothetical protein